MKHERGVDRNEIIWDVARSAPNPSEADEVLYIGRNLIVLRTSRLTENKLVAPVSIISKLLHNKIPCLTMYLIRFACVWSTSRDIPYLDSLS